MTCARIFFLRMVAQLVEHSADNAEAVGSSPSHPTSVVVSDNNIPGAESAPPARKG